MPVALTIFHRYCFTPVVSFLFVGEKNAPGFLHCYNWQGNLVIYHTHRYLFFMPKMQPFLPTSLPTLAKITWKTFKSPGELKPSFSDLFWWKFSKSPCSEMSSGRYSLCSAESKGKKKVVLFVSLLVFEKSFKLYKMHCFNMLSCFKMHCWNSDSSLLSLCPMLLLLLLTSQGIYMETGYLLLRF